MEFLKIGDRLFNKHSIKLVNLNTDSATNEKQVEFVFTDNSKEIRV